MAIAGEWKGYSVSIPSFRTELDPGNGKVRTIYDLQVIREGKRWRARHFYSEFHTLYTKMCQQFPKECGQLSFPSKRCIGQMLNNTDGKFLEIRRTQLESYMIAVTSMYKPASCETIRSFLEFPEMFRTDEERRAAADTFKVGAGKAGKKPMIMRRPPLDPEFVAFKERRVKLLKSLPKPITALRNEIEDVAQAEDFIREMIIDQARDGQYFRVLRRKMELSHVPSKTAGTRMFVRLGPEFDCLHLFSPPKYGDKVEDDATPIFVIPLSTVESVSTMLKPNEQDGDGQSGRRPSKQIHGKIPIDASTGGGSIGSHGGSQSMSPAQRLLAFKDTGEKRRGTVLTLGLGRARMRRFGSNKGHEEAEVSQQPIVVRLGYNAPPNPNLVDARASDSNASPYDEDENGAEAEFQARMRAEQEGGKMILDVETTVAEDAFALADSVHYLLDNPKSVSENTAYEINMLADVLAGLMMMDIDIDDLGKTHNPKEPPAPPPAPANFQFVHGDLQGAHGQGQGMGGRPSAGVGMCFGVGGEDQTVVGPVDPQVLQQQNQRDQLAIESIDAFLEETLGDLGSL